MLNVGPESSVAIVVAGALAAVTGREHTLMAAQLALLIAVFLMIGYVTRASVLVFGVLEGIVVGVVVSLLEVLRRAVMPYTAVLGHTGEERAYRDAETLPGLVVYRFDAPLFLPTPTSWVPNCPA